MVDRAKKLSDAELIVKLASSSVGERIFRDLRSEIYISSEENVDFIDIDISKYLAICS